MVVKKNSQDIFNIIGAEKKIPKDIIDIIDKISNEIDSNDVFELLYDYIILQDKYRIYTTLLFVKDERYKK